MQYATHLLSTIHLHLAAMTLLCLLVSSSAQAGGVTTTTAQVTTTSTTTSTTLLLPELAECGDFTADGRVLASDALGVLQAAVGSRLCGLCICDVDDSGAIVASDALTVLRFAVGQAVAFACPAGGGTVEWDGGGDGTLWEDAANWMGDRVPDACEIALIADDAMPAAVVNGKAELVVRHESASHAALAVFSSNELVLAGGTLSVAGPVSVANRFVIGPGKLSTAQVVPAVDGTVELASGATLDDVTMDASGTAGASVQVAVTNGLTVNGGLTFGLNAGIRMTGSGEQRIDGDGTITLAGGGVAAFLFGSADDTVIHIGADMTVTGAGGSLGSPNQGLIIDGTLTATPGFFFTVESADWTNNGTLEAPGGTMIIRGSGTSNGAMTVTEGGALRIEGDWLNLGTISALDSTLSLGAAGTTLWDNDGTIAADNSTVNLYADFSLDTLGAFTRSGGSVIVRGTFDNSANLVLDDDRGDWTLASGGSIVGGTVTATAGHELNISSGTLDGVTLDTPLDVAASGSIAKFINGTILNGPARLALNGQIQINGTDEQTLAGTGEVHLPHSGVASWLNTNAPAWRIGAGIRVHGASSLVGQTSADLTNEGTIETSQGGNPLNIQAAAGTNAGQMTADQAELRLTGSWSNTGNLLVHSGRTILVPATLDLEPSGTVDVQITSLVSVGKITVTGKATLAGSLTATFVGGFEPAIGNTFRVLNYGSVTGTFDSIAAVNIGVGKALQANMEASGLTLEVVAE